MKAKRFVFSPVILSVAAASLLTTSIVRKVRAAPAWTPYQLTYKTYNTKQGWTQPVESLESHRAVRTDGSTFESFTGYRADGSVQNEWDDLHLAGGISVHSSKALGLMTATKNPGEDAARQRQRLDPAKSCAVSLEGGSPSSGWSVTDGGIVSGYRTFKIVVEMKDPRPPAPTIHRGTIWRAPALDCAELRALTEVIDAASGHVLSTSDRRAYDIRAEEPDASLFRLPVGYRNVSPVKFATAQVQACCGRPLKTGEESALPPGAAYFQQYRYDW
jgi:hypothetical protein